MCPAKLLEGAVLDCAEPLKGWLAAPRYISIVWVALFLFYIFFTYFAAGHLVREGFGNSHPKHTPERGVQDREKIWKWSGIQLTLTCFFPTCHVESLNLTRLPRERRTSQRTNPATTHTPQHNCQLASLRQFSECQIECLTACQLKCQIECQNTCQDICHGGNHMKYKDKPGSDSTRKWFLGPSAVDQLVIPKELPLKQNDTWDDHLQRHSEALQVLNVSWRVWCGDWTKPYDVVTYGGWTIGDTEWFWIYYVEKVWNSIW